MNLKDIQKKEDISSSIKSLNKANPEIEDISLGIETEHINIETINLQNKGEKHGISNHKFCNI